MNKIIIHKLLCYFLLLLFALPVGAQSGKQETVIVEGLVINEENEPMAGVKVGIQERNISEITDTDGKFYMLIAPNEILVINEKGYYPVVKPIGGITTHTLTLFRYKQGEEEAVQVAFGEQTKRNTTISSSSINADVIEKNSVTSIEQAMNGTLSGVYSLRNGGEKFGKNNFNFLVRGKATTGNAEPLILVDGMEFNIELMDFHEVESITVLKDAAALAMYGMRGANGVILIKTKQGSNLKSSFNIDIRAGIQQPTYMANRLNAYQYTILYNEALTNDGNAKIYNPDVYKDPSRDIYSYPDEDFKKMYLGSVTPYQNYNFSASGGNNIAQYFVTANYLSQEGIFKNAENNNNYDRFNFRTNLDINLIRGLNLSVLLSAGIDKHTSPFISDKTSSNDALSSIFNTLMTIPANAFPVFNRDNSLGGTAKYQTNPEGLLNRKGYREDETRLLNALVKGKYELDMITKGLSVDASYGFENYNMQYTTVARKYAVFQENSQQTGYTQFGTDDNKNDRDAKLMDNFYRYTSLGAGINYQKNIANVHELLIRLQYHHSIETVPGDNPDYKYQSLALRAHYGWQKKYYGEITAAYQGSTNYKKGKRTGIFPALGLAWIVSEENWLKNNNIIDFFKVRASYGLTGNDQTGGRRFAYRQEFYGTNGYAFGRPNGGADGSYEGVLASIKDTWERSYKANIGFDMELFKGLSVTVDYFNEQRHDILVDYTDQIPDLIGIGLTSHSAGKIKNQGIDASIRYIHTFKNGGFFIGGNILWAKNEIIDLKEKPYPYAYQYRRGHSIDTYFGYKTDGLYTSQDQLVNAPAASFGVPGLGNIKYINQNPEDDNLIDENDKVALGNELPELIYGINLGVNYKGFDLQCFFEGSGLFSSYIIPEKFSTYAYDNRWTPSNPTLQAAYPRMSISSDYNQEKSDFWEQKAHLFRISSMELGYTLPESAVKKIRLSSLRFYVNANNLFTFSNVRDGRDPEAYKAGYSQYPLLRTICFGLSLKL